MSVIFRWCFFKCPTVDKCHPYHNQTFQTANQLFIYLFIYLFGKFTFDFQFSMVFLLFVNTLGNVLENQNKNGLRKSPLFLILFPSVLLFCGMFLCSQVAYKDAISRGRGESSFALFNSKLFYAGLFFSVLSLKC